MNGSDAIELPPVLPSLLLSRVRAAVREICGALGNRDRLSVCRSLDHSV
jgi:hypothetical protein